jgi:hypothetical protein
MMETLKILIDMTTAIINLASAIIAVKSIRK